LQEITKEDRGVVAKEADKIRKIYIGVVSRLSGIPMIQTQPLPTSQDNMNHRQEENEQDIPEGMLELKADGEKLRLKRTNNNIKLLIMALKQKLADSNSPLDEDDEKKMDGLITS